MKKKVLYAAMALVALASCSSDDLVGESSNSPNVSTGSPTEAIVFNSGANTITRTDFSGSAAATKLGNLFVVEGVKSDGNIANQKEVFDHYNVKFADGTANTTTSNTAGWEYVAQTPHAHASISAQTIKYWDYAESQYDFIAYSAGNVTAIFTGSPSDGKVLFSPIDATKMNGVETAGVITDGAYTIKGKAADLAEVYIADLKTAYRDRSETNDALGDYNNVVQFKFRSLSAKVRVALYETVPGYSVQNVVFYTDASTEATDGKAHLYTTGGSVFNEEGTYIVYFPTTGSANKNETDYNKAHLVFKPKDGVGGISTDKEFGALDDINTYVGEEVDEDGDGTTLEGDKLYIGRSSNTATYAGDNSKNHYTIVIPNETGAVLNLKVNYELVSTDGSKEVISVTGATAQVPAEYASWKSGYAYTYLFKISQNTNGLTNPDITSVEGLYPITFDAVVMNSEVDGIQETITTVATPSITTYTKGKVVTSNDEYKTGNNIYVVVDNDGVQTLKTTGEGINAKLYTVTLTGVSGSPAQTINEASVANALKQGGTVTDINGWTLSVTTEAGLSAVTKIDASDSPDGNAITVNGAKFTPSANGIYVFQYLPQAAVPAVYYTNVDDYNTAHSAILTSDDFAALSPEEKLKTPAVAESSPDKCKYKIIRVGQ